MIIGITAAPRKLETLHQTLEGIAKRRVIVFAEPNTPYNKDFTYIKHEEKLGAMKNFDFALRHLLENYNDNEIVIAQDDLYFSELFNDRLNRIKGDINGQYGFVSFYTSTRQAETAPGFRSGKQGWISFKPSRSFCGALFLLFNRRSAEWLLKNPLYRHHVKTCNQQIDYIVGRCFGSYPNRSWLHNPSLISHTGFTSTVGHYTKPLNTAFGLETWDELNEKRNAALEKVANKQQFLKPPPKPVPVKKKRGRPKKAA